MKLYQTTSINGDASHLSNVGIAAHFVIFFRIVSHHIVATVHITFFLVFLAPASSSVLFSAQNSYVPSRLGASATSVHHDRYCMNYILFISSLVKLRAGYIFVLVDVAFKLEHG